MTNAEARQTIIATIPTMAGWTPEHRAVLMFDLILERKPKLCVELGIFGGRTLFAQAMALRQVNWGRIVGIDPWRKEDALEGENEANRGYWGSLDLNAVHNEFMAKLWAQHLEQWAIVIRSASQHCAELFSEIDSIFIDGNHSEPASCRDVELYLPRVKRGGLIMMDDCDWPSTQRAIGIVASGCDLLMEDKRHNVFRAYVKR